MSERSSFVTENIGCSRCLAKLLPLLTTREKYLCGIQIPSWNEGNMLPIIAGKIGARASGLEWEVLQDIFSVVEFTDFICHPIRLSILHDNGDSTVFVIHPNGVIEEME